MPGSPAHSLVGRAEDVARLRRALDASAAGHGGAVLVAGEAGIGKTRLLADLAETAEAAGTRVLSGRCIDLIGPAVPFYSLIEALRSVGGAESAIELPELTRRAQPPGSDDGERRLRLFELVWDQLTGIAASAPVLIVLEDLHWADGSTLDFVAFGCRVIRRQPILLVATYRTDDMRTEDPLARTVVELVRSRDAEILEVGPLPDGEMAELLEQAAVGTLPRDLLATIVARSGGNPFFAEELLASAQRGETSLPWVLRAALRQRIERVPPAGHEVLRVAAAFGRDIPHRLLASIVDLSGAELDEALRQTIGEGVLVVDREAESYRFRHALLAEVAYELTLPGEMQRLHERVARALTAEPGLSGDATGAGELARHWDAAGRAAEAFAASIVAARAAETVYGLAEALEHLERALRLWPGTSDAASIAGGDRASVMIHAAELADLTGRGSRAAELARAAVEELDPEADPVRSGVLHSRLGTYLLQTADRTAGLEACERAVSLIPAEPPTQERARALTALGNALMLAWRHAESERVCLEAIHTAETLSDPFAALRADGILGIDWCYLGRRDDAQRQVQKARDRALHHGTARDIAHIDAMTCEVLIATGCVEEAARVGLDGRDRANRLGVARSYGALLAAYAAEAYIEMGEWNRVETLLTESHRTGTYWPHYTRLLHAQLATAQGRFDVAEDHIEAAELGALQPTSAARYTRVVAELAIWQGRPGEAVDRILETLGAPSLGAAHNVRLAAIGLWAEAERIQTVRTASRAGPTDTARQLLAGARRAATTAAQITPEAQAWLARAEAEHSRWDRPADPRPWRTAVTAWEELGRPYHTAYCRWRLAESLLAGGSPRTRVEARQAVRLAYRSAASLGATPIQRQLEFVGQRARIDLDEPSPPPEPDPARTLGLTNREAEVLRLLTRGYTNRDIAGELTISVKTASVHVSHILAKLGVSRRIDAAAIGQRLDLPAQRRPT